MRIAFMGTPEFAVPVLAALLAAGHQVVAVYSQPPRPAGRGMREQRCAVVRGVSRGEHPIIVYDSQGNFIRSWGEGDFTLRTHGITVGPDGTVYATDDGNHTVRQFTPDGFYRSGDLMRRHRSGNFVVEGRKKDLINRGGEKISAEEIENLILMHPCVQNVACVPVPDPELGERMCACLILKPGRQVALAELVEFLKDKEIAKFKLPERLLVCDDFPVSAFGKVSKKALSDLAAKNANH